MPVTLSLVLVVRREQAYLEEFATAALAHAGDAIELLAVDDAASAHAPAVLDRLAAADPRVRVLRLPERAGLGAARAAALAQAAGEYVWFADGGDLIPGLGAAAVLERLRRTRPDVLLVHHTRVSDSGAERPGPHRRALAKLERAEPAPMGDRLAVGALASTLYDKVFRTAALAGLAVDDDTGLAVTWPALHAATRIDALAVPAYQRRVRPMVRREHDPAAQFAGYDAAFAGLGDLAPGTRRMVATAMLRHQLELLRALPAAEQRPFLARMAESWRAHAEGVTPSARPDRLYAAVAARGDHRGFRVLEAALAARRAARRRRVALYRRRRRALKAARRRREERRYKAELRKPIDPDLAVFAAYWFRGYQCNPRAIYEAARELVPGMRGVWVVRPEGAKELPEGVEHVAPNTPEYFAVLARARYFVNNVNFPDHLVKRPGTTHVMTHHGTPLKYMGLDERRSPVTKMDFERLAKRCSRWDFSITANPHTSLIWERVYPYDHETLEVGYPRNDVLATAGPAEVAAARAELGLEDGQTAVLYAPTHRDGDPGFVPVLDLGPLADALGPDHVLLARAHYFYAADPQARRLLGDGRLRDVSSYPSVERLCLAADVLITDYSSIMFDYATLDRPIVIHAPDWERYRILRGTYFDLLAEPPGAVARSDAELIEAFRSGAVAGEEATRARAAFRERFCSLEDGHSAERVVRRVWFGESPPT